MKKYLYTTLLLVLLTGVTGCLTTSGPFGKEPPDAYIPTKAELSRVFSDIAEVLQSLSDGKLDESADGLMMNTRVDEGGSLCFTIAYDGYTSDTTGLHYDGSIEIETRFTAAGELDSMMMRIGAAANGDSLTDQIELDINVEYTIASDTYEFYRCYVNGCMFDSEVIEQLLRQSGL